MNISKAVQSCANLFSRVSEFVKKIPSRLNVHMTIQFIFCFPKKTQVINT